MAALWQTGNEAEAQAVQQVPSQSRVEGQQQLDVLRGEGVRTRRSKCRERLLIDGSDSPAQVSDVINEA